MRTFAAGQAGERKTVQFEVNGRNMVVIQTRPDGLTKRSEKQLASEVEARSAGELMARELRSRGFVEEIANSPREAAATKSTGRSVGPASRGEKPAKAAVSAASADPLPDLLYELENEPAEPAAPLQRLLAPPAATSSAAPDSAKKASTKKKKKKKKKAQGQNGDALDKRVVYGMAAAGVGLLAFLAFIAYDAFLKPPSLVGSWRGSRLDYEAGGPMSYSHYQLVLDANHNASMTLQETMTSSGTYKVQGDRLILELKDEEGGTEKQTFKYVFSGWGTQLDLVSPEDGKKLVTLTRLHEKPVAGKAAAPAPAAPTNLAKGPDAAAGSAAADAALVSQAYSPKGNAFTAHYPEGWESKGGAAPDNTYAWAEFNKGSARIRIDADVQGSLMSGADSHQPSENDEYPPVAVAHDLKKKAVAEDYSNYSESEAAKFDSARMGEGRIAEFTASAGGLFGGKIRGYRATLLTTNHRVTLLCQCPEDEWAKLQPTFLAACRSISR